MLDDKVLIIESVPEDADGAATIASQYITSLHKTWKRDEPLPHTTIQGQFCGK